ncbi:hypothetical protein, partial [Agromyces seonyuensis]
RVDLPALRVATHLEDARRVAGDAVVDAAVAGAAGLDRRSLEARVGALLGRRDARDDDRP